MVRRLLVVAAVFGGLAAIPAHGTSSPKPAPVIPFVTDRCLHAGCHLQAHHGHGWWP